MTKRLCVISLSVLFYNIRFVLVIQLLLNRDSPELSELISAPISLLPCGVLEHDRAVVTSQGQGPHYSQISHTHTHAHIHPPPHILVLHNLPLFPLAVTLLIVYGVIFLLGFTTCSWTSKFNYFFPIDHLIQLALREVMILAVFIFFKCVFYTLGAHMLLRGLILIGYFSFSFF